MGIGGEGAALDRFLEGKHAIVTGGGRGIGAAVAAELARLGANLTLMGRDRARLAETAARIGHDHAVKVGAVRCDVSSEPSVAGAFGESQKELGDAYVLVNNAGIAEAALLLDTTLAQWERALAVNATGAFLCIRRVLPAMLAAGAGRIVNIASTAGLRGGARISAYVASKHALVGLTRALALETAKRGVTVNAVCPGWTDTDMFQRAVDNLVRDLGKSRDEARDLIMKTIPRRSLVRPEEVASAVAWLCSPDAAGVTGQCVVVAGGEAV